MIILWKILTHKFIHLNLVIFPHISLETVLKLLFSLMLLFYLDYWNFLLVFYPLKYSLITSTCSSKWYCFSKFTLLQFYFKILIILHSFSLSYLSSSLMLRGRSAHLQLRKHEKITFNIGCAFYTITNRSNIRQTNKPHTHTHLISSTNTPTLMPARSIPQTPANIPHSDKLRNTNKLV